MFTDSKGKKLFILGVNYWPSSSAISMWSHWNLEELEDDVKRMKGIGINLCRFFIFMSDFMPIETQVDPVMIDRLIAFLNICEKYELYTMPSFFVGHMSGEDWDVGWRNGRNILTDSNMIKAEKLYISEVVKATKQFKFILGWLLSNELPNYVGQQEPEIIEKWTEEIINTIKYLDSKPVSIGDGAWSPEVVSEYDRWKFQLRKLNKYQDFVGLHYYPRVMKPDHHAYTTAFRLRMAQNWKKPVFVEEFGTSTVLCSEENQAHYYREVFFSALINGAFGTMGWCLNDFDFKDKRPYSHHAFEDKFGIVRMDKSLKPTANEYIKFSKIVKKIYSDKYQKIENNAGLIIPSNYYYKYPYQFEPEFDRWYDFYLETFGLMKNGFNDVECIFEPAIELNHENDIQPVDKLDPKKLPLVFAPRLKLFTKKYWLSIVEYVKNGGNLYCSFANDSWVVDWHKVVGVEMDCKFGVPDFRDCMELEIKVEKEFGEFQVGDRFKISLDNSHPEKSYCKIISDDAEILMRDQFGSPFLHRHKVGKGNVYFTPYPLEILALGSNDNRLKLAIIKIYKAIYNDTYTQNIVEIIGNDFEFGIWKNIESGNYKVIILNHSWENTKGQINVKKNFICKDSEGILRDESGTCSFSLKRKGVLHIEIQKV
ncbi:MAG: hypothetical protein JXQ65_11340 [Candidatus Marinimicrobia bacterium]|nr:hypothetical protein [Candidatus Neomarinimicrobiota bacterium]